MSSPDRLASKNSFFPNAIDSTVGGFSGGIGTGGNPKGASMETGVPTTCAGGLEDEQDDATTTITSAKTMRERTSENQQVLLCLNLFEVEPRHFFPDRP